MQRVSAWSVALVLVAAACSSGTGDAAPQPETITPSVVAAPAVELPEEATPGDTAQQPEVRSFAGAEPAPEFPQGLDWLNTSGPLSFEALRGKTVLLDFWTYGCINCIHIIPDLKRLETEFPDELVVIGVHSAKFLNEGSTDNIRQVILRYGLEHPIVNDRDFEVWRTWGANAWPTVVVVDPAGNIVGGHSGEGVYATVQPVIQSLIDEFDAKGLVDRTPLELELEAEGRPDTLLSFPGKVLADAASGTLYIADSGHHRIVAADPDTGDVLAVYGRGTPGFEDGEALQASFSSPQGMALSPDGSVLYVADTNNHALRTIDLSTGVVATYAGTGRLGWPPSPGRAPNVLLNSPWDLAQRDGFLYIAMAGHHQIWLADLTTGEIGPIVGNARESVVNGPLAEAELAQPSGLAFDAGGRLYFADSESSSIRYADVLDPEGVTGLVAGSGENLFDFGDVDGAAGAARLQHPLGVAFWPQGQALLVADTYNSKVKRIDIDGYETTTLLGGDQGWADGTSPLFYEPGGLSISEGTLYVADTNNHVVRIVDLETFETTTLILKGIERFSPPPDAADYKGIIVNLDETQVSAGAGTFRLQITLPAGYKVNEEAPSSVVWSGPDDVVRFTSNSDQSLTGVKFPVDVAVEFGSGQGVVSADINLVYCRDDAESLCFIEQLRFTQPVSVGTGTATEIVLRHEIPLPNV